MRFYIMSPVVTFLLIVLNCLSQQDESNQTSYWESKGQEPFLAQIIHTPDDQGRDVLHINLFLSSSCTTCIYYAMPLEQKNSYVLTDTFGKVVEQKVDIVIKNRGVFKLKDRTYKRITEEQYFADMKKFEKQHK